MKRFIFTESMLAAFWSNVDAHGGTYTAIYGLGCGYEACMRSGGSTYLWHNGEKMKRCKIEEASFCLQEGEDLPDFLYFK